LGLKLDNATEPAFTIQQTLGYLTLSTHGERSKQDTKMANGGKVFNVLMSPDRTYSDLRVSRATLNYSFPNK